MAIKFPPTALVALDTETTGKDPETARVVEICLAIIRPGAAPDIRTQIIDPGMEIPDEAAAIHRITTDRAQAEGKPPAEVLDVWVGDVVLALRSGLPLVIQNAQYDLTVLDRDCRRHGLPTLGERLDGPIAPILDPLVLDKRLIKYRKRVSPEQGARCLKTLCQVYGAPWDDERAHGAEYDALQAARVVWKIGAWSTKTADDLARLRVGPFSPAKPLHSNDIAAFRSLTGMDLMDLHRAQAGWYREQTESFADWLRKAAEELRHQVDTAEDDEARAIAEQELAETEARIDGLRFDWPLIPHQIQEAMPA